MTEAVYSDYDWPSQTACPNVTFYEATGHTALQAAVGPTVFAPPHLFSSSPAGRYQQGNDHFNHVAAVDTSIGVPSMIAPFTVWADLDGFDGTTAEWFSDPFHDSLALPPHEVHCTDNVHQSPAVSGCDQLDTFSYGSAVQVSSVSLHAGQTYANTQPGFGGAPFDTQSYEYFPSSFFPQGFGLNATSNKPINSSVATPITPDPRGSRKRKRTDDSDHAGQSFPLPEQRPQQLSRLEPLGDPKGISRVDDNGKLQGMMLIFGSPAKRRRRMTKSEKTGTALTRKARSCIRYKLLKAKVSVQWNCIYRHSSGTWAEDDTV